MTGRALGLLLFLGLYACGKQTYKHPYSEFFFPYNEEVKVYVFKDHKNALKEQYYRVFGINDSYGKHIVLEMYSEDARLLQAYNYQADSLFVMDHMVVDRNKKKLKALLMKRDLFPGSVDEQSWFASKFPGFRDSTIILSEIKRNFVEASPQKMQVMDESRNVIVFRDTMRMTAINLGNKKENQVQSVFKVYFAEGVGLFRIEGEEGRADLRLDRILSQEEWLRAMK
ncbi:MAG: hypothetical protein EP338_04110 [Bacteroidetes bacterium]|nr:MAG: hypothetical protein EP338_04110 [Bacteroidota bacterium]